ncbi:5-formyltetrahydrofolate cyclo-ligase [Thermincola potens]|uniref:5-formyltetrahydrofolate cyclo-ligase n=1 Tax=Thermincola potens (strain JR) TaxID=635013 RepID=D5XCI0_THEPJ|nr:5-formyltetrahydrofolate cyclo-ligase [Thermincola potens]ADG81606.1 5-formyltetrahydrofolate cyclo-ligase [Thermincola potens JR]
MKRELRKKIIADRMAMSNEEVTRKSQKIAKRLEDLPEYREAGLIMFYIDFRNEVQTGDLIKRALARGKRVVVPITVRETSTLIPSEIKDFPGDLTNGTWGILEPQKECIRPVDPSEIDVVIVPGVSFDTRGNRMGYGGGFYDRFLPRTKPDAKHIALAFELQMRDNVYPEEHDQPVHYVITEERVIKCFN